MPVYTVEQIISSGEKKAVMRICDSAFGVDSFWNRHDSELVFQKINMNAVFLCACNKEVFGYLAIYANDLLEKTAFITLIAVKPSFQKYGVGTRLIREAFDIARFYGMERVKLEVRNNNYSAISFYLKNGFHKTEAASEKSTYMIKNLVVD